MRSSIQQSEVAEFEVENVGGIDSTHVEVPPGVTVLTGRNATNRTSFLQSIMAVTGSDRATLKADADEGYVHLDIDGETYRRELTRKGDQVSFNGDSYLDDPDEADLFAFLLETNEARQSVVLDDNLRDVIMQPVDTDEIENRIRKLEGEKSDINDEIAEIESRRGDLPDLEQEKRNLQERIDDKREQLSDKEEQISESSGDIEESQKEKESLETKLQKLRSTRAELESIRQRIEKGNESLTSLRRERSDLESELDDLPETPMGDHKHLEKDIGRLRNKRQALNTEISDLQGLIQYNNERLEQDDYEITQTLDSSDETASNGSLTDELLAEEPESIVCWTCGSTVEREQIEETVGRLQDLRKEKVQTLNDVKSELDDLKGQQREAERKQNRREEIERKLDEIEDEMARRETRIESLKSDREALTEDVETLETEVDNLESNDFDEVLTLHKEANQLEFEIDSLESDLERVTAEIEEIESLLDRAEELRAERAELADQLTEERTKIDRIEADAIESFNEHMDAILDILEYENLDRIWIERVEREVREGRQKVVRTVFQLHIVRTTANGAAYEDTIDHLSESEREVTGLIFALAGYLVHDLHETIPFMLLDSLEAIDSHRIARLIDYFEEYTDYLIVALLPEDAQAIDDNYTRITDI